MPRLATPASILAIAVVIAGSAWADSNHHDRGSAPLMGAEVMPGGGDGHEMMGYMMEMMMQMHGTGAMGPGMGPMAGPGEGGMSMMDRGMMQMMLGPDMVRGMTQDMPGQMMMSRLEEYDADGDGALSLDEFAAWHAAMMRETMVDRFQHLDADGNGAITSAEMNALAGRMDRMREDDMGNRPMMPDTPDPN